MCRKPPPVTRPPPPPPLQNPIQFNDESLLNDDEVGSDCSSSLDPELHQYNCVSNIQINTKQQQLCEGRESGYGTNKSRLWGSPPSSTSSSGLSTVSAKQPQQQRINVFNENR